MNKIFTLIFTCLSIISANSQLTQSRIADIADIKVERFQNILDLTPAQSSQFRKETINMLTAQGSVSNSENIADEITKNLNLYYNSLSSLKPQQLATLKLMDSMDRQSRRDTYKELMKAYGQSSEFAIEVAAYNWNVAIPILVSYRKDLDRYITPADRATIAEVRSSMIVKYNFINTVRENNPSVENEAIISAIQDEIITDINKSAIPRLLKKYDERINNVRIDLQKHEKQINSGVKKIYEKNLLNNHKNQIDREIEFLNIIGVSKLLRDSFFLLLDGDSRSASFKINALHLMSNELQITDQF